MLSTHLGLIMNGPCLSQEQAESAMQCILNEADPYQVAAFLAILKYRGETPDEVNGMVTALRKKAVPVSLPFSALDIVGTGGDMANTVNISTGSAILAAACGIPVAKHGNRSASSLSGSADVLEELGVELNLTPEEMVYCITQVGIGFMFAPAYHPSMLKLAPVRKGLKLPTIINILGPMLNPANVEYSLIGVASEPILELMSEVVLKLPGKKRTLLFHGNGLDELTSLGKVVAYDIQNGQKKRLIIDPEMLGFSRCHLSALKGGDAKLNALILRESLKGQTGAVSDALIFNAGAALWVFGKVNCLQEGVECARSTLIQGKGLHLLEKWIDISQEIKSKRKA